MRHLLLIAALLTTTPAAAYCPSVPDGRESRYVENNTARTLCLQRELATTTDLAAEQARIQAELGNLQIEFERQRILQQQMIVTWPQL